MTAIVVVEAAEGEARDQLEALAGAGVAARQLERPRALPGFALLARAGQAAAGYALLAHTRYRLGEATVEAIEITALAAARAEAREALLGAAVAAAQQSGLPFLTLRRPAAAFAEYGLAPAAYSARLSLQEGGQGVAGAVLRAVRAEDLDDLAALQAAAYAPLPLGPLRAAPDWRWMLTSGSPLLVLEDSRGRAAAYAQLGTGVGGLLAREAGAADAGAARALVAALGARAGSAGGGLGLELPPGHVVARAALRLGAELSLRAPTPTEPARLWGVVDLAGALGALMPELRARLAGSRYAGWSGWVLLEGAGGAPPAALAFEAGGVSLGRPDLPPDVAVRQISLGGLAQLLLGYRDAGDLRASGELQCADVDLGLIDTLFPALSAAD